MITAHYPSDVIASAFFGILGAILVHNWFAVRRLGFVVDTRGGACAARAVLAARQGSCPAAAQRLKTRAVCWLAVNRDNERTSTRAAAPAVSWSFRCAMKRSNVAPLVNEIATALQSRWAFEVVYVNDGSTTARRPSSSGSEQRPWLRQIKHAARAASRRRCAPELRLRAP